MQLMSLQIVKKIPEVDSSHITYLHVGADGLLYTYGKEGVKIWDKDLKMTKKIPLTSGSPGSFVKTNSCFLFTTDDMGSRILVYNRATHAFLRDFQLNGYCINDMDVNEEYAVVAAGDEFYVIDLDSMQQIKRKPAGMGIYAVALYGNYILVGTIDNVDVYDRTSWERVRRITLTAREPKTLLIDGDLLYIGANSAILVIDLKTYQQVARMEGHNGPVVSLRKVGTTLFSAGADKTLKMWDLTKHGLVNSVACERGVRWLEIWNGQLISAPANPQELEVSIWGC